jgi:hypothetical protein
MRAFSSGDINSVTKYLGDASFLHSTGVGCFGYSMAGRAGETEMRADTGMLEVRVGLGF